MALNLPHPKSRNLGGATRGAAPHHTGNPAICTDLRRSHSELTGDRGAFVNDQTWSLNITVYSSGRKHFKSIRAAHLTRHLAGNDDRGGGKRRFDFSLIGDVDFASCRNGALDTPVHVNRATSLKIAFPDGIDRD